ncbi:P-loop containing nucleoside triphosphate hydrolase protein [Blastocladiella britannica]|nr:P-loop containing nucleoside triphosphate hydrolase protein [Blastocladiella britannica]
MNREQQRLVKIVVVGDPSCGKTALIHRFVYDRYSIHYLPTMGLEVYEKSVKMSDNANCTIQLWDVPGALLHARGLSNPLHDADAVVIVYDITQPQSFKSASAWLRAAETACSGHGNVIVGGTNFSDDPAMAGAPRTAATRVPLVAVAGNKTDLAGLRIVTQGVHGQFADDHALLQYLTSARVAESVYSMFLEIAARLTGTAKDDRQVKTIVRRLSVASLTQLTGSGDKKGGSGIGGGGGGMRRRISALECPLQ